MIKVPQVGSVRPSWCALIPQARGTLIFWPACTLSCCDRFQQYDEPFHTAPQSAGYQACRI